MACKHWQAGPTDAPPAAISSDGLLLTCAPPAPPPPPSPRANKPALCLDKSRKCRSADWKRTKAENAENADAYRRADIFFFKRVRRQSCLIDAREYVAYVTFFRCCPRAPQSREGKREANNRGKGSAKGTLKKQSDAIATKGTKAKMASAGMAMYQGSTIQGFRSGQTKKDQPHHCLILLFLQYSCAQCECCCLQGFGTHTLPPPPPPPITPRSMANCWRGPTTLCSLVAAPSARRRTAWLVTLFRWNDLASEGLG
jgi:hypothetical protein